MYQRILWVLVADPLGSAEHTLGATGLEQSPTVTVLLNQNSIEYLRHKFERVLSLTGVTHNRSFIFSLTSGVNYYKVITFSQTKRIYTRSLSYLTISIVLHSNYFARQQVEQHW
jgi:hypothetical protein